MDKNNLNYLAINKHSWNNRLDTHLKSDFYNLEKFLNGETSLNDIELQLLGDVNGKKILHLQCHFGQDSISLSRLGANVTGVDLSDKAIEKAKELAIKTNVNTKFINCDIYSLDQYLDQKFDIVYTSYGTITWLPDLEKWAQIISKFLKPEGQFVFVEFHPVVWMYDDNFEKIKYNYFKTEPIIENEEGSYADRSAEIEQSYVTWNHSLSEVIQSLIQQNLVIKDFKEYNYSPYNCFNNTIEIERNKYRIKPFQDKIPMLYSIIAKK